MHLSHAPPPKKNPHTYRHARTRAQNVHTKAQTRTNTNVHTHTHTLTKTHTHTHRERERERERGRETERGGERETCRHAYSYFSVQVTSHLGWRGIGTAWLHIQVFGSRGPWHIRNVYSSPPSSSRLVAGPHVVPPRCPALPNVQPGHRPLYGAVQPLFARGGTSEEHPCTPCEA
jgi:hypothetical protein